MTKAASDDNRDGAALAAAGAFGHDNATAVRVRLRTYASFEDILQMNGEGVASKAEGDECTTCTS